MAGNITEEQFKKFCKDFVEKYEGRNFQELVKSLGKDWLTVFNGVVTKDLKVVNVCYGLVFRSTIYNSSLFGYDVASKGCFNFTFGGSGDFYTIEELYKFFKMDYKETEEPTNVSKVNSKVTFNVPIETIKDDYIELLSKKHNLNKESIELKIVM